MREIAVAVAVVALLWILYGSSQQQHQYRQEHSDEEFVFKDGKVVVSAARQCESDVAPRVVCPGLTGTDAMECVAREFRPTRPISYAEARRVLFNELNNNNNKYVCVYGGHTVPAKRGGVRSGRDVEPMNIEHIVPQSLFRKLEYMRADLHHLFPTHQRLNMQRSNHRLGVVKQATRMCALETCWNTNDANEPRNTDKKVDRHQWSWQGGDGTWQPPLSFRGDAARAVAYIYSVYQSELSASSSSHNKLQQQQQQQLRSMILSKEDMVAWHAMDPVDGAERARSAKVSCAQGNHNPFVMDDTLLERVYL